MHRRDLLTRSGLLVAAAAVPAFVDHRVQDSPRDHAQTNAPKVCTPADALSRLLEGNCRFAAVWRAAAGSGSPRQRMDRLREIWENNCQIDPLVLDQGQKPYAAILS